MNDFLDNFNGDSYRDRRSGKQKKEAASSDPLAEHIERYSNTESRDVPEDSSIEYYEKDPGSAGRKRKKVALISLAVIIAILLILGALYFINRVSLPDFVGGHIEQAQVWAVRNNVYLEIEEVYDLEFNRGMVVSQSPSAGNNIFKGGSARVVVSMGPDPGELIDLPDFTTMDLSEIERWIAEVRADNVSINRVYDDTVPENQFVKKEFRDPAVNESNYKRENRMIITVSRGPEEIEKNIEVPDFTDKPESEAVQWADQVGVGLIIEQGYSDTVQKSYIISQNINPKTKIDKTEKLTIRVSEGKAVSVPSFQGLSREEAEIRAAAAGVNYTVLEYYHDTVGVGQFISQSVRSGTRLTETDDPVILTYSLGRPFIPDFSGQSESDVLQTIATMNDRRAFISLKLEYIHDGRTPAGSVIFNSEAGTRVPIGSLITVMISKGGKVVVGDYVNKNIQSEDMITEIVELEEKGLKVVYQFIKSTRPEGTIIRQSISPGRQVNTAEQVLILEISD